MILELIDWVNMHYLQLCKYVFQYYFIYITYYPNTSENKLKVVRYCGEGKTILNLPHNSIRILDKGIIHKNTQ